jgi:hypothetical protein
MSFCGYLKQSTIVTLSIGPALDDDDATTQKTGTLADTDFYLSKNGGAKANPNDTADATNDSTGIHRKQINATDTNALGLLTVYMYQSDVLYIRQDYQVVNSNWYDTMCSTDQLDVNTTKIEGSDPTDTIRDSVVDDATRIDASRTNALPTAAQNTTAILAGVVEGTTQLKQALQTIMAFCAHKVSGGGTTQIKYRDKADSKDRITVTVDSKGNRSAVTYDLD